MVFQRESACREGGKQSGGGGACSADMCMCVGHCIWIGVHDQSLSHTVQIMFVCLRNGGFVDVVSKLAREVRVVLRFSKEQASS